MPFIKPDGFNLVNAGFQPQHLEALPLRVSGQMVEHRFAETASAI